MRGLLKGYADRGGTVLLSSHLLHEVEMIADEMILIGRGKIVAQGDKKSLLAGAATATTLVTSLDNAALGAALTAKGFDVQAAGEGLKVGTESVEVGRTAAENNIVLTDLRYGGAGLEDLFLELTADTQREAATEGVQA
jgi:ABC-2 type transport system ATP-binding protein